MDISDYTVAVVFHPKHLTPIHFVPQGCDWRYHTFIFHRKTLQVLDMDYARAPNLPTYLDECFKEKNLLVKTITAHAFIDLFQSQNLPFKIITLDELSPFLHFFRW
jgi:hypothetical protein